MEETVSSFRQFAYGNGFQFPIFLVRKEYENRFGGEKFWHQSGVAKEKK
jgi:hypothetical protein